ncbi:hypothetical protein [Aminicella lysinilytica]|uniref:Uncharacterized protein n=1 Tax=Aminicella lysinilytica TaxID=433323 RepID=A0A4R6QCZ1_9FIRM|nr:hypothetical protein [Aminicella lysinilytica]TDP59826.1 hypothetical protein EV211_10268 [Aminicella lysinilytica]
MKSVWKVSSNYVGGTVNYEVIRLMNKDATDHGGNREIHGVYDSYKEAYKTAEFLNSKEAGNDIQKQGR